MRVFQDDFFFNRQFGARCLGIAFGELNAGRAVFLRFVQRLHGEDGAGGADAGDFRLVQPQRLGDLGIGRLPAQFLRQRFGLAPDLLRHLLKPGRFLDNLRSVPQIMAQMPVNMVRRIGDQLDPARRVVLINAVHQAQKAFLHQIFQGNAGREETAGPASGPAGGIAAPAPRAPPPRPARRA